MAEGQAGPGPEGLTPAPDTTNSQSELHQPTARDLEFLGGIFDGSKWQEIPTTREGLMDEYIRTARTSTRLDGTEDLYNEEEWKKEWERMERRLRADAEKLSDKRLRSEVEFARFEVSGLLSGEIKPLGMPYVAKDPKSLANP